MIDGKLCWVPYVWCGVRCVSFPNVRFRVALFAVWGYSHVNCSWHSASLLYVPVVVCGYYYVFVHVSTMLQIVALRLYCGGCAFCLLFVLGWPVDARWGLLEDPTYTNINVMDVTET